MRTDAGQAGGMGQEAYPGSGDNAAPPPAAMADATSPGGLPDSCLARIRGMYPGLRPAERRVADFLLAHPGRVARLSIGGLARETASSDSTVVKLAQHLGYAGFRELKLSLAMEIAARSRTEAAPVYGDIDFGDSLDAVRSKLLSAYQRALQRTMDLLDTSTWDRAAEACARAHRLHFYGVGASGLVALDAQHKFARIGLNAWAFPDPHMQSAFAALLGPQDVAVGISHSGGTLDTVNALRRAAEAGATTICITHRMDSPLAQLASIRLFTGAEEMPFRSGAIVSRMAQLAVVDALFIAVVLRMGPVARERLAVTRQAVAEKHLPQRLTGGGSPRPSLPLRPGRGRNPAAGPRADVREGADES